MTVLTQAETGGNNLCASVRFQHQTTKVHDLGARPYAEMLARLARLHPEIEVDLLALLDQYAAINGEFLRAAGLHEWRRCLMPVPSSIKAGTASRLDILKAALSRSGDDAA